MGENFKKKTAGLAAKAASSVIKGTICKDKDNGKGKDEAKKAKLEGKAAEAAAEAEKLAAEVEKALQH